MSAWPDWLKLIQLKPRFLFGIWFFGALLLFLPDRIAVGFGIVELRGTLRGLIGLLTLLAFTFWFVQLLPLWHTRRIVKRARAQAFRSLQSLSAEEWLLVAYCLNRQQQTITLELTHAAAGALKAKGIFVMAGGVGNSLAWPFTVPDFLWDYLRANPHVIFNDPNDPQLQARFEGIEHHIHRHDFRF